MAIPSRRAPSRDRMLTNAEEVHQLRDDNHTLLERLERQKPGRNETASLNSGGLLPAVLVPNCQQHAFWCQG